MLKFDNGSRQQGPSMHYINFFERHDIYNILSPTWWIQHDLIMTDSDIDSKSDLEPCEVVESSLEPGDVESVFESGPALMSETGPDPTAGSVSTPKYDLQSAEAGQQRILSALLEEPEFEIKRKLCNLIAVDFANGFISTAEMQSATSVIDGLPWLIPHIQISSLSMNSMIITWRCGSRLRLSVSTRICVLY